MINKSFYTVAMHMAEMTILISDNFSEVSRYCFCFCLKQ
jgi:hypothetical protein